MASEESTEGMISRAEAANAFGLSRSGLRRLEGVELSPVAVGRRVYYRVDELERVLIRRSGDASRAAFRLFEEGAGPVDAVLQHGIDYVHAERMWEGWLRLKKAGGRTLVIEMPNDIKTVPWCKTFGFDPESGVPGLWALRAIEEVARHPAVRARIDRIAGLVTDDDEGEDGRPAAKGHPHSS